MKSFHPNSCRNNIISVEMKATAKIEGHLFLQKSRDPAVNYTSST